MIKNLRIIRQKTGKSQKEVAYETGIGYKRYNSYETGVREPDSETLLILADYFDVSVDYLLGRTDEKKETGSPVDNDGELSLTKKLLIEKIKQMDDTTIAALDALASQILDKRGK